ncbi:MAG: NAD(+)/NADH kinase [Nitrospirae bacterium]|nr:NAD(+)/NADH kinase [Nitrospirota bacterium]
MKTLGIIVKKGVPAAIDAVRELLLLIDKIKFKVLLEEDAAKILKIKGYRREVIASKVDLIMVLGGDGTLLSAARLVGQRGTPILGINLGSLGFITEIPRDEISREMLDKILGGKYRFEERIMLSADVYRNSRKITRHIALNDVVINKSALARMVGFEIHINDQYVTSYRADGLIISTPTGSTAHSLSAGGPILYPTLESFVMTPICPHTLTNRPLVLPDKFGMEITIKSGHDVYLTLDGQEGVPLKVEDKIKIRKADFKTRFLLLHKRDYFQILRTKLKWGE